MTKKKLTISQTVPDPAEAARGHELEELARARTRQLVESAPRRSFGLTDLFDQGGWISLLEGGFGPQVLRGSIIGATEALVAGGLTALDLEFVPSKVTIPAASEDLLAARRWIAERLVEHKSRDAFPEPETTLAGRGWTADPVRITSLILAVIAIAESVHAWQVRVDVAVPSMPPKHDIRK